MAKVRQILRHIRVEIAGGRRQCRRNRSHSIERGDPCLVIQDHGTPFAKSYCPICALAILKQSATDLKEVRDLMYGGPVAAESADEVLQSARMAVQGNTAAATQRHNM